MLEIVVLTLGMFPALFFWPCFFPFKLSYLILSSGNIHQIFTPHARADYRRFPRTALATRQEFQRSRAPTNEMEDPRRLHAAPPPMNSSEMAREVLHLKSTLLNLDEENALLKREANALSERLTLLEDAYHGHDLWKWAGAFEMDAGEYDWTFVG